jgi:predicted nucleotide-binding protein
LPRISNDKALSKIHQYLQKLDELESILYQKGEYLIEEMHVSLRGFIPLAFDDGKEKIKEFDEYVNSFITSLGHVETPSEKQENYEQRLRETKSFLTRWKDELELTRDVIINEKNTTKVNSKKVFIVYGHDNTARLELEGLLIRLGLQPIILDRRPDMGRTIIEKFEAESKGVQYAFVLLTPDDEYVLIDEDTNEKKKVKRARQNVVFELGFFIGFLERDRVCAIIKKGVEIPSDVSGVLYKSFTNSINELYEEIRKELKTAGYSLSD